MKHEEFIAKEGWPFIGFFLIITLGFYWVLNWWAALIPGILMLWSVYFFRNPRRSIPGAENELLSPADGKVMDVMTVTEDACLHREMLRVRIFLNIFNVHVNRVPVAGTIKLVKRAGTKYLAAFKDQAGALNVRNYLLMDTAFGEILVVQITGLIARRLVCWVQPGDRLARGERFGLIRFGSCTELYLEPGTEVLVREGDKVRGGETIIARIRN